MENINDDSAIKKDDPSLYKKIKSVPKPKPSTNLDDKLFKDIIASKSEIDISTIEEFTRVSYRRNDLYNLIDEMAEDPIIAAILETYTEDATEYNEKGQIVWAESSDSNTTKYVNFLLETMQVNKHIYQWTYSFIKYGDLYFRLYRQSEVDDDRLFDDNKDKKKELNEDVKIRAFNKNDPYVLYTEIIANSATMYELTRMGKTSAYIQTNPNLRPNITQEAFEQSNYSYLTQYKFNKSDILICQPNQFVHAILQDESPRYEEEVTIFLDNNMDSTDVENKDTTTYKVRKGQSMLFNMFKIWRELSLLENSILLNRITKSAIVRLINVEVGDMPKENVGNFLERIKSLMEQKSAVNEGKSMHEYTNPGPIENNIYVPTYGGIGALTTSEVGGDVNIGQLPDIEYFQNKFFGSSCIPKQYFGLTDDGAGFNGGQSLAIISSRYAKRIKRIQSAMTQAITDIINLILIDKGMVGAVNNFSIHMQPPTTQEEIDRRDSLSSQVQISSDIMNLLSTDIEDPVTRLKALKVLLSSITDSEEITSLIEDYIDKLEKEGDSASTTQEGSNEENFEGLDDFGGGLGGGSPSGYDSPINLDDELGLEGEDFSTEEDSNTGSEDNNLPTPEQLGVDMTDNDRE